MKVLGKLLVFVVAVLAVLVLARNVVVKAVAEGGALVVTGMPLSIGKLDLDLSNTLVDVENLVLKNPAGFHDTELVNIPKIFVDYNFTDILKGTLHLEKLEFDMKQFTVVKNEKGELNLDRLKALQGTQKPKSQAPVKKPEPQSPAKAMPVQIDNMRLKIGKVVYIDYSSGKPSPKEFLINLDQSYQNITELNSVVRLIVLKAMMSSGIANLTNFDIAGLQGSVTDALNASAKLATEAAAKGLDTLNTVAKDPTAIVGQTKGLLKGTTGTVGSTAKELKSDVTSIASSLKNKLKLPFGKSE